MQSSRALPAPRAVVWDALNDTEVLRACIAGCERLERTDDGRYLVALGAAVGPVKARFSGHLTLADLDPPRSYRLVFDVQGAAAGFGKGSAEVTLGEPEPGTTQLDYRVNAQVGGRIAQVGSRLVDAAAKKVAADFFDRFERALAARRAEAAAPAEPVAAPPEAAAAATPSSRAPAAVTAGAQGPGRWWPAAAVVAALVAAALLAWPWLTRGT